MTHTDYQPEGKWAFDDGVTGVFDAMLARSIPQYEVMRDVVTRVAGRYARPRGDRRFVDLGSSRGEVVADLMTKFDSGAEYHAVEVSGPMLDVLRERFERLPNVSVHSGDLRWYWPKTEPVSVVTAVLTLMFVPIEHRARVVLRAYDSLAPGGALVMVEKVLGEPRTADVLSSIYHDLKRRNGYTGEEIDRKALSLEGVLVPVTAKWNEDMLRGAGFADVECIWRWMNFAAWVAVKA